MLLLLLIGAGVLIGLYIRGSLILGDDDRYNDSLFRGHEMKVRGVSSAALLSIADGMDLVLENLNVRRNGEVTFSPKPARADSHFARHAPSGRSGRWTCYHGFKVFILAAFEAGATSVRTAGPRGKGVTYRSEEEFRRDLTKFADREVGIDVTFIELCDHGGAD